MAEKRQVVRRGTCRIFEKGVENSVYVNIFMSFLLKFVQKRIQDFGEKQGGLPFFFVFP